MPNRKRPRVSRRQAVSALSAGAVGLVVSGVAGREVPPMEIGDVKKKSGGGTSKSYDIDCTTEAPVQVGKVPGTKVKIKRALYCISCCPPAHDALHLGVADLLAKNDKGGTHLKKLASTLDQDNELLEEHCFIAFGLKPETVQQFAVVLDREFARNAK
jgi:hypothetical protein